MERKKTDAEDLDRALRSLPVRAPSGLLKDRIMEAVRKEASRRAARAERTVLWWAIGLSAVILLLGGYVLCDYMEKVISSSEIVSREAGSVLERSVNLSNPAHFLRKAGRCLPVAGSVLVLLLADSLLHRHWRKRGPTRNSAG
ncbi:MAG: hypothetical protein LUD68_05535 [Rikenellaceae bacterium]|nr:hypothetical protein [Rikenellaceae bacterium]